MTKPTMTSAQLKARLNEEAPEMVKDWKAQGQRMTLGAAKQSLNKVLREEYNITA